MPFPGQLALILALRRRRERLIRRTERASRRRIDVVPRVGGRHGRRILVIAADGAEAEERAIVAVELPADFARVREERRRVGEAENDGERQRRRVAVVAGENKAYVALRWEGYPPGEGEQR